MISRRRVLALAALAALLVASFASASVSAESDWCKEQRARCLKRCGGKDADMDFDCRDKSGSRSVSCSCANGAGGFSGGDGGSVGSGVGVGSGLNNFGVDQVARDGFNNVARVARGESPVFFGGADSGSGGGSSAGVGRSGGSGGSAKQAESARKRDATTSGLDQSKAPTSTTPAWAIALAVIATLVAAAGAGAAGFLVMKKRTEATASASTPSLPMYDAAKPPAFAPSSPISKAGHSAL